MITSDTRNARRRIDVFGVVQGVGFRPHVARLAQRLGLVGWVRNTGDGVRVEVEGSETSLRRFEALLTSDAPPLADIVRTSVTPIPATSGAGFRIETSGSLGEGFATVPPDAATCTACLAEMNDPENRRYRHGFISCTDCGPRWTIVTGLPYDRERTTMADFVMCAPCSREYHDPTSRRYHAQPIACRACGPRLRRLSGTANTAATRDDDEVLAAMMTDLAAGRIVALKGIGGFHLVVDATNHHAVSRLRRRKHRPDKPFAIMVKDLAAARRLATISEREAAVLTDPARPVVLLRRRDDQHPVLSEGVAPRSPLLGIILPYSPLHHLLFRSVPASDAPVPEALVMTSGNIAGEPIVYRDNDAIEQLGGIADALCFHDRRIVVPCDDSVVRIIDGQEAPIRRSRGYAPLPIELPFPVDPILAVGGDIKNTCCVASGARAIISQHLGDMETVASQRAFDLAADGLTSLHGITPTAVVVDRHPGYLSRATGERRRLPVELVGHHHAHLAALMVEHSIEGGAVVAGFVFDGTGWGEDNSLWGGEVLVGGYGRVQRRGHLLATRLPGNETAVRNPWRMALAHLSAAGVDSVGLAPSAHVGRIERRAVEHQIMTGFNSPWTSSMGRLVDAVASILDVRHTISHEAQAAIELEAIAASTDHAADGLAFAIEFSDALQCHVIDPRPLVRSLVAQLCSGVPAASLALGFHLAIAAVISQLADRLRVADPRITSIGLSGGVFQNKIIASESARRLRDGGFRVLTHRAVPANDGGLSLGQVAVAGYRRGQHSIGRTTEPCV